MCGGVRRGGGATNVLAFALAFFFSIRLFFFSWFIFFLRDVFCFQ